MQVQTPNCGACDNVDADLSVTFAVNGSQSGIVAAPSPITILAAGPDYVYTSIGQPTTTGSFTLTATASALPGSPTVTSNTVSVPS